MAATDYIGTLYNTSIRGLNILDDYVASVIKPYTERPIDIPAIAPEPVRSHETSNATITQSVLETPEKIVTSEASQELKKITDLGSFKEPEPSKEPEDIKEPSGVKEPEVAKPVDATANVPLIKLEISKIIESTLDALRQIRLILEFSTVLDNVKTDEENQARTPEKPPVVPETKMETIPPQPSEVKAVDLNVTMEDVLDEKIDEIIAYVQSFQLFLLADNKICSIRDFLAKVLESRGNIEGTIQSYLEKTLNILSYNELQHLKQSEVLALQEELENSFTK